MRVIPVPCLSDNYAYLVARDGAREAAVIDPSEGPPVLAALAREGLHLAAILCTHHHLDHVGGNEELREQLGALPVYAHPSDASRVPLQSEGVADRTGFRAAGLEWMPLHVPGHTLGAVAYCAEDAVFTGDTLFVAGCGRLFEGTPERMYRSLNHELGQLPPQTRVYCGHEYTVANLRFAVHVEPDNPAATAALEEARATRGRRAPTVPSTIQAERAHNPFLRCDLPALRARFPGASVLETFAAVRKAKDTFR